MYFFPNFEPVCYSMSHSNCCFLTCIQISQDAGKVVWYFHLFENFPVCCDSHSQRLWCSQWSRGICFFWNSLAFLMIQQILAIWTLVPLPFLNSAWTSGSSQFTYYWSLIWRVLSHIGLAKMLLQFLRHIFHFHQEFYWAATISNHCVWTVDDSKLWKILKEMGIPDHLTCLLRNLHAGQEATVKTRHGTTDWFKIGKEVCQGCILSCCLSKLCAEYIMWNARLDESQAGIKTAGRNINNLRYADDTTLIAKSEEE